MKFNSFQNSLGKLKKNNISIIGHMGSGKSVIGSRLGKITGLKHIDSDKEIIKFTKDSA